MQDVLWQQQITFDKNVAFPNEQLFCSAALYNPNAMPIYIGSSYWSFSCYPGYAPGLLPVNKILSGQSWIALPPWNLPIPEIIQGQYELKLALDTWRWDYVAQNWVNYGTIQPDRGIPFFIIHAPRFRAFISRSNRDNDRPIVDPIVSIIQKWGFDTHTVGINEIEINKEFLPERIINEILKSDCVIAVATPRDISYMPPIIKTLTWLQNEVSFSFMSDKPTLIISDATVTLNGLLDSGKFPIIRYQLSDYYNFLVELNNLMPVMRKIIMDKAFSKWQQAQISYLESQKMEAFIMGMIVQKRSQLK